MKYRKIGAGSRWAYIPGMIWPVFLSKHQALVLENSSNHFKIMRKDNTELKGMNFTAIEDSTGLYPKCRLYD